MALASTFGVLTLLNEKVLKFENLIGLLCHVNFSPEEINRVNYVRILLSQYYSAVVPKVCSADHWWSARLAEVVHES